MAELLRAIVSYVLAANPGVTQITGGLAWFNFLMTATKLSGRDTLDMEAAEDVVAGAIETGREALARFTTSVSGAYSMEFRVRRLIAARR